MKLWLLPFLLVATALFAAVEGNPTFSGKWQVHQSIAGNDSDQTCTFTQQDKALTGTCNSERGAVKLTGKVDGKTLSWSYETEYEGNALTVKYTGALDAANKIVGTVSVDPYNVEGEFTATLSK